jgi:hypothetical protein
MSPPPFPPHAWIGWSAYPGEASRTVVASGSVIGHRFAGLCSAASDSAPAENVEEHANHLSCSIPPRLVPGPPRHAGRAHASTLSRRQASAGRRVRLLERPGNRPSRGMTVAPAEDTGGRTGPGLQAPSGAFLSFQAFRILSPFRSAQGPIILAYNLTHQAAIQDPESSNSGGGHCT